MDFSNIADEEQQFAYLDSLNPEQLEAVKHSDGALLVLAGAGTGKTKVLTTRIAHILSTKKAYPSQVLSVTFTNKAAREMRHRVEAIIGPDANSMWLGTFHSIAARILRRHAQLVGLNEDFTIIDNEDQTRLAKQLLKDYNIDEKNNPVKLFLYLIGRLKDKAITPDKVPYSEVGTYANGALINLYKEYERRLITLNAVDFSGLILHNITLFNKNIDLLEEYQRKFRYILVDEYQDTNVSQYLWLRMLAQAHNNICCVGDDDQSIYGWRGAEVTNILRFDKDFKDAQIIRLERNYRSTSHILSAATALIANNRERHGKTLWTERSHGEPIKLSSFYDDREEARFICEEIENLQRRYKHKLSQIAILIRAGYQTRSFEESLNFLHIPYKIVGGLKFYDRAEIKDAIAYIRFVNNPDDSLAFERVVNTPRRGVGLTAIQRMHHLSREHNISLSKACELLIEQGEIKGKVKEGIQAFFTVISAARERIKTVNHWEAISLLLNESGYIDMWKADKTTETKDRLENLRELTYSLQDFASLGEFLEHVSLVNESDNKDDTDAVNVMTIHAAKGLEFQTVFLGGWEEGVFPSSRSSDEGKSGLEEERRLAYVAITRARERLYISFACNRRMYGSYQSSMPSRFVDELPADNYEMINNYGSYFKKHSAPVSKLSGFGINKITSAIKASIGMGESAAQENAKVPSFKRGQRVFHQKFGYGIIASIAGEFANVAFDKSEMKRVMVDYLTQA